MKAWGSIVIASLFAAGGAAVLAQEASSVGGAAAQPEQMRARFQISAMEGVLERAVLLGAQKVRVRVQPIAPDLLFVNGTARALSLIHI